MNENKKGTHTLAKEEKTAGIGDGGDIDTTLKACIRCTKQACFHVKIDTIRKAIANLLRQMNTAFIETDDANIV